MVVGFVILIGLSIVYIRKNSLSNSEIPLWWIGISAPCIITVSLLYDYDREPIFIFYISALSLFVGIIILFMQKKLKDLALFFWWLGGSVCIIMLIVSGFECWFDNDFWSGVLSIALPVILACLALFHE